MLFLQPNTSSRILVCTVPLTRLACSMCPAASSMSAWENRSSRQSGSACVMQGMQECVPVLLGSDSSAG